LFARSGIIVCVCEPQARSTDAIRSGSCLFVMSKMCRPSNPGGTKSPSQDARAGPVFEFHERLRMSP
jgi:hypothetical protein